MGRLGGVNSRRKAFGRGAALIDKVVSALAVVLILACLTFFALASFGKVGLLIVQSGSMSPRMPAGSLVVFREASVAQVRVGDVIVFRESPDAAALITHRVAGKTLEDGRTYLKTKGDRNHRKDTIRIGREELVGTTMFVIPAAGRMLAQTKTPAGLLVLHTMLALFVMLFAVDRVSAAKRRLGSPEGDALTASGVRDI